MPYITKERREKFFNDLDRLKMQPQWLPENAGELNFHFTEIAIEYLLRKGLKYGNINDVIGALEGAKMELYRRVAGPYEDSKVVDNGDVYPIELITNPWEEK